jgi:hypothetical protein
VAKSEGDSGIQSQYLLRSEFYLRRAIEYAKAWHPTGVPASQRKRLDWRDPSCFGISSEAWARVIAARLDPALVFCHPDLAAEHSECLGYYARAACISGKGLARLCSIADTAKPDTHRSKAPVILNRHVSTLIESERRFLAPAIRSRLQLMSYGAEVNGSWRNQVGRIGAEVVQKVLMEWLSQHGVLDSVLDDKGRKLRWPTRKPVAPRTVVLSNGFRIRFGSEPDIAIRDADGVLQVAIEVKAGLDSAGAQERYGACKKSFDKAFDENKAVQTIYLASSLTGSVLKSIARDRIVREHYDLAKILSDEDGREHFLQRLAWLMHLEIR